jgi:hypothetical protein
VQNVGIYFMVICNIFQQYICEHFVAIWKMLRPYGTFNGDVVNFVDIWYIFPVLVRFTKNNLATLACDQFVRGVESKAMLCTHIYISTKRKCYNEQTVHTRVARFFLLQHTKTGKIYQITNEYVHQMAIKYTEWP